jgi:hypothetical protein
MKTTYLAFIVGLLFTASIALRAQESYGVSMSFTLDNGKGRTQVVTLGAKDGATTGIDANFGESELPPAPPNEIFDVRVTSMPGKSQLGEGVWSDFRPITNKTGPFMLVYAVGFQGGTGASNVKLTWDQPYPGRISKVTVDGNDIATKTEVVSSGVSGQFTIELTMNFIPLTFTANPASLSFVAGNRDPLPDKTLEITPVGDSQAAWQIVPSESWLSVSPNSGSGKQTVDVSINTNQIPNGQQTATLLVRSPQEPAQLDVPVTLTFTVGTDELTAPNGMRLGRNYPNPFVSSTSFDVDLGARVASTAPLLRVYDVSGKAVADLSQRLAHSTGLQTVTFDAADLSAGMYTVTLSYDGHDLTRTMVVAR